MEKQAILDNIKAIQNTEFSEEELKMIDEISEMTRTDEDYMYR